MGYYCKRKRLKFFFSSFPQQMIDCPSDLSALTAGPSSPANQGTVILFECTAMCWLRWSCPPCYDKDIKGICLHIQSLIQEKKTLALRYSTLLILTDENLNTHS